MNKVFLIGNLTRDPERSESNSGVTVCHFSIAVNRPYSSNGERQTDFFNITAWRGLAENVARFCKKGTKVAVSGSIQMRTYEGNDGVKRTAVDIIAQDVEFLSPKAQGQDDFYDAPAPSSSGSGSTPRKKPLETFEDDGDIPF